MKAWNLPASPSLITKQHRIALAPTEIVADQKVQIFDYEQKYMPGKATEFTPARCSLQDLEAYQTCIHTGNACTLQFNNMARIDGFLKDDGRL